MSRYLHSGVTWVIAATAFLLIAATADWITTRVFIQSGSESGSSEASKVHRLFTGDATEIPIFGASKARSNYDPAVLGHNTFNYGMDSASMDAVNCLLRLRMRNRRDGIVIIDMFHFAFNGIGDVSKFVPFATDGDVGALLERENMMKLRYRMFGLRYFGLFDLFAREFVSNEFQRTRRIDRGFTYAKNSIPWNREAFNANVQKRLEEPSRFRAIESQDKDFLTVVDSAPDCIFVLVYSPLHASFFENFGEQKQFETYKDKFAMRPNIFVLDWSRMSMRDELFENTGHLNESGAKVFSQRLREFIENLPAVRRKLDTGLLDVQ